VALAGAAADEIPAQFCTGMNCLANGARPAEACQGMNCATPGAGEINRCDGQDCNLGPVQILPVPKDNAIQPVPQDTNAAQGSGNEAAPPPDDKKAEPAQQ
jgi:hypothetical protein